MNSFTEKVKKTAVCAVVSGGLLLTTACGSDNHPASTAPESPAASHSGTATVQADNSPTPAQQDTDLRNTTDKPLGIDPASVPVPADVTAAFGEKASANLVRDALEFQAAAESFHQLQVLPLTASADSITEAIKLRLGPYTTPQTLADITTQVNSPHGSAVIPGFTPDQAENGIPVDGVTYHAIGQGISFSNGQPVVALGKETIPVTQNGRTIQGHPATVAIAANIAIPAKEGTVNVALKCLYNLVPTSDGHWLVAGYQVDQPLTATPNGAASK